MDLKMKNENENEDDNKSKITKGYGPLLGSPNQPPIKSITEEQSIDLEDIEFEERWWCTALYERKIIIKKRTERSRRFQDMSISLWDVDNGRQGGSSDDDMMKLFQKTTDTINTWNFIEKALEGHWRRWKCWRCWDIGSKERKLPIYCLIMMMMNSLMDKYMDESIIFTVYNLIQFNLITWWLFKY